ncbi:hypothetical protein ACFQ0T_29790 [Kitasatospora gansuensis]
MSRINPRPAAARLRAEASASGWESWQLVQRISTTCEVSLLQSHRLARGWTLDAAVTAYALLRGRLTVQQLSSWEARTARPGPAHLDGLCALYETRPDRLGFAVDYTPAAAADSVSLEEEAPGPRPARGRDPRQEERQQILRSLLHGAGVSLSQPVLATLAGVRQSLAEALTESVSELTMEQWERSAAEYGHAYQMRPPRELLAESVLDFVEVQQLLEQRQAADYRTRLCHVAAQLAGTAGIALVALGEQREARSWFRCAQLAAEETADRGLRAWLIAREAVIPFYYGSPRAAADLAERARMVAGGTPSATAAWAPSLEARALARLGRADDARQAMRLAEQAFARLDHTQTDDTAYGYTARQLQWHIGSMHTTLGDTRRAQAALDTALTMYAPAEYLDRALIALDQAAGLINVGEVTTAAQVGLQTLERLPAEHRTGIVVTRAREIAATIPARAAGRPLCVNWPRQSGRLGC